MTSEVISQIFLGVVVACSAGWLSRKFYLSPYRIHETLLLWLMILLARCLWRTRVFGQLPVAGGSGAVVVCNHRSSVDPMFLQLAADRPVHWMVAREYYQLPIMGSFLRTCRTIPARRGAVDSAAVRTAIRLARQGELVGMFPEGRINMTDELLLPGRPGAALIAVRAGVPLIPCYISGAPFRGSTLSPLWTPTQVTVRIGSPIAVSSTTDGQGESESLRELTRTAMAAIARLARRADFQPQLAGRNWMPNARELEAQAVRQRRRTTPYR